MAEQRPGFRFRLPWLPAAPAPPPTETPAPTQPSTTTTAATQPTPTVSVQRPPFRPAGLAPVPLPQAQVSTRSESQPSSPARAAAQSRVTSQPSSPSRPATQSRATAQPSSPSRPTTQSQAATAQPSSPSRAAPQPRPSSPSPVPQSQPTSQPVPQPRSPSRLAPPPAAQKAPSPPPPPPPPTQTQPTPVAVPQPPSPPKKLQPTTPKSPQPLPTTTKPPPSTSLQEPMPPKSQIESKEPQPKTEITFTNVLSTQNQTPKPDSSIVSAETKPFSESVGKAEEITKKGPEQVQEVRKEGKTAITSSSNAAAKEQPSVVAIRPEQKLPEKKEILLDTKETSSSTTSASDKKHEIKNAISHLKDKITMSESHQKPSVEQAPLHKEIKDDISKLLHKTTTGHTKRPMNDKPVHVITLAGENRGASMQLGSDSAKREGSIHIHRGYKTNPDEATTTDGEGSSRERSRDPRTTKDQATKAYVNNNTQGINNSIVFNSSVTEQNPGVKLFISHNPQHVKPSIITESSLDAHKSEFTITPAQKLTYEPTVRRRCLRGLFMESSDSDPDNPEKPQRHGCRYICRDNDTTKDNEIDVV